MSSRSDYQSHSFNSVRTSFRDFLRALRQGEVRLLFLAIVIAVAGTSSINFVTDRIERALQHHAADLMGADFVVQSTESARDIFIKKAQKYGLAFSSTTEFPTVIVAGDHSKLSGLKAVGKNYPLRGTLKTGRKPYGDSHINNSIPRQGEAWVDSELFNALRLTLNQKIQVGYKTLKVTAILAFEPDRGNEFFNIAPRLMINKSDLEATRLIQRGSRIRYKLLFAGSWTAIQNFSTWAKKNLNNNERVQSLDNARPALRTAINFGGRFLSLASLLGILLAGVAIAISARQYARNQLDRCAMLRCLGATQKMISRHYIVQLCWIGLVASSTGAVLGYGLHELLLALLHSFLPKHLPLISFTPVFVGLIIGATTLFAFALPPILALRDTSPLRVIRRDLLPDSARKRTTHILTWISILTGTSILLFVLAGDIALAWRMLIAILVALAMFALISILLVKLLAMLNIPLSRWSKFAAIRFGLANMSRRATLTGIQISGFGIGIMALLILSIVRTDLLTQWRDRLPANAPNQFLINIQSKQIESLKQQFRSSGNKIVNLYPMVRGRLTHINSIPVSADNYSEPRAKRLITREFNLSQSRNLQKGNTIFQGSWWNKKDAINNNNSIKNAAKNLQQISIESGLASLLRINVGDTLEYLIAGQSIKVVVTSLRKVSWDTMRPNFFAVMPQGSLDKFPMTWIGSFYLSPKERDQITLLVKQFPNLTVIDVAAIISQIHKIMDKVVTTIEYVFVFTLLAGFLVLFAILQASRRERIQDAAILRTLGATQKTIIASVMTEFISIGLLAGLIAAFGATLAAWLISSSLLNIEFVIKPAWWLTGTITGGVGTGIAGLIGSLTTLRSSPLQLLRKE